MLQSQDSSLHAKLSYTNQLLVASYLVYGHGSGINVLISLGKNVEMSIANQIFSQNLACATT